MLAIMNADADNTSVTESVPNQDDNQNSSANGEDTTKKENEEQNKVLTAAANGDVSPSEGDKKQGASQDSNASTVLIEGASRDNNAITVLIEDASQDNNASTVLIEDASRDSNANTVLIEDAQGREMEGQIATPESVANSEESPEEQNVKKHATVEYDVRASDKESLYNVEPTSDNAFRMGTEVCVDPAIISQISNAFVQRILPTLEKSKASIKDVLSNQIVLIETLEQENCKFKDCTEYFELSDTMVKAKEYCNKLHTIKKDMTNLHERAAKLKRRALKLQQQKHKEEFHRARQQEKEIEKEQMLTARIAHP